MAYDATRSRGAARIEQAVPLVIPPAFDPTPLQNQINQKANASTVGGLATAVNSKASQSSVDTLAGAVAGKASSGDLTALAATVPVIANEVPQPEITGGQAGLEGMTPTPSGAYTGCVIKVWRSRPLPTMTPLSLTALLTAVVTGVNALISALTNYDIFGASAVGTTFTCIAVQRSDS